MCGTSNPLTNGQTITGNDNVVRVDFAGRNTTGVAFARAA